MLRNIIGRVLDNKTPPPKTYKSVPSFFTRLFTTEDRSAVYSAFDEAGGYIATHEQADRLLQHLGVAVSRQQLHDSLIALGHEQGRPLSADECVALVQSVLYGLFLTGPSDASVAFDALGGTPDGLSRSAVVKVLEDFQLPESGLPDLKPLHNDYFPVEKMCETLSYTEFTEIVDSSLDTNKDLDAYTSFDRQLRSCSPVKVIYVPPSCSPAQQAMVLRPPVAVERNKSADPTNAMKSVIFREILQNRVRRRQEQRLKQHRIAVKYGQEKKLNDLLLKSLPREHRKNLEMSNTKLPKAVAPLTVKQTLSRGNCHIDITEPVQERKGNVGEINMKYISNIVDKASRIHVGALRARKHATRATPSVEQAAARPYSAPVGRSRPLSRGKSEDNFIRDSDATCPPLPESFRL